MVWTPDAALIFPLLPGSGGFLGNDLQANVDLQEKRGERGGKGRRTFEKRVAIHRIEYKC
jgi:hypothetical protein